MRELKTALPVPGRRPWGKVADEIEAHREVLAALALFQEAARQDRLTVEKALEVAVYLREARHEPSRRFAWSPAGP